MAEMSEARAFSTLRRLDRVPLRLGVVIEKGVFGIAKARDCQVDDAY